jgi:hypothetical protein
VTEAQDQVLERRDELPAVREQVLRSFDPRPARPRGLLAAALVAAACGALAIGGRWWSREHHHEVVQAVAHESAPGWLVAPGDDELGISLPAGVTVTLFAGTKAMLRDTRPEGSELVLASGTTRVSVPVEAQRHVRVSAGPYEAWTSGGSFEITWVPSSPRLRVRCTGGLVEVNEGPPGSRSSAGAALRQGEQLSIPDEPATPPPVLAPAPPSPVAPGPPSSPVFSAPSGAPWRGLRPRPTASTPAEVAPSAPPAVVGWQELASKGRFAEAYAAADASGLARICEGASARELLTLSEAARLSGHATAARRPLLAARTRFPGSPEEAAATFALGRIAFDELHDDAEAAQWFATILREHPAGSLTREATGRLIESLVRGGDLASARAHAARYLETFPTGPHAPLARRVLDR